MRRILVCMTGGTFSTQTENNVMDVSADANDTFKQKAGRKYLNSVDFIYIYPVMMLSENMTPEVWGTITGQINQMIEKDQNFDGIIVTHGSDTAPYTTAFLGHYYHDLPIPVVVTASNAPIDEPNANGWNNFFASVDFILNAHRAGTYFIYQSGRNRGDIFVFASDEIREADVYSDEFSSSTPYVFGKMESGQLIARENKRRVVSAASWAFEPFHYQHKVLGIKPYPGLDYSVFNLKDSDIKAVVHQSYHSNTHNCSEQKEAEPYSILAFVKQCEAMGIQVFLSDFPKSG